MKKHKRMIQVVEEYIVHTNEMIDWAIKVGKDDSKKRWISRRSAGKDILERLQKKIAEEP